MRVITKPDLEIVAASGVPSSQALNGFFADEHLDWKFERHESEAQDVVEIAGRTCYQSWFGGRPHAEHVRHMVEVRHGSVLEHAVWTVVVHGVSRSLTHELIRHRAGWAYSEMSQRYVDFLDQRLGLGFVCPVDLLAGKDLAEAGGSPMTGEGSALIDGYARWLASCGRAVSDYSVLTQVMLDAAPAILGGTERRKWARQAARSVLPECAETRIVMTANARSWRWFWEARGDSAAEPEIRRLAVATLDLLGGEAPEIFGDCKAGGGVISVGHGKV